MLLLTLAAVLAVSSLVGDSITFDETSHLTAGMSYLKTADYRFAPDHPPLAKMWCALPLLLVRHNWPLADSEAWVDAKVFPFGRHWLFDLNDGQRLLVAGRCMMVILLLATCLATYALARRLFGPRAGLLALTLAVLSPSMLAHGRLVTTDIPITLCMSLTLLTFAGVLERRTWLRLLAAGLALAAAAVTKMSWPLVVPALAAMALAGTIAPPRSSNGKAGATEPRRRRGDATPILALLFLAAATWMGIWTCFRWRIHIFPSPVAALNTPEYRASLDRTGVKLGREWRFALYELDGTPRAGLVPAVLRWAADVQLLPDAYLLGLAQTYGSTRGRRGYLMGEHSVTGWRSYFPIAYAIKTPIATMGLVAAGLLALVLRRTPVRDGKLALGLAAFAAIYVTHVIFSSLNIGERHLLPIYPALFVCGGAAAAWLSHRLGRWLIAAALIWLAGANASIYPHYLAYFNELVGGPRNGHKYLVDSNIDWGQDLLRLADYAREHPHEPIKLAYFGSARPTYYVDCKVLPGQFPGEPEAELTGGTYVASITTLSGVYDIGIRDEFWTEQARAAYVQFAQLTQTTESDDESPEFRELRREAAAEFPLWQARLLLNRLSRRTPDDRIGYSLFVYRLTDAEVEELIRP